MNVCLRSHSIQNFKSFGLLQLFRFRHSNSLHISFMASSIIKTPLKAAANQLKRRANGTLDTFAKKIKKDDSPSPSPHDSTTTELERGIIDREFYPPEMTNARCLQYTTNQLARPIEVLDDALRSTTTQREGIVVKDAIVHWFKCDLRTTDNKALYLASEKAKANGVPLICMYIISPQDLKAHVRSPVRVDFTLRTLEVLKDDLRKLEIPLYVETVEKRKAIPHRILELCEKWGARHLFANIEYEVDELRREALMVKKGLEKGIAVEVVHDTCVVAPGELKSKTGNQYAVYSPWFRAWIAYLHSHPDLLELYEPPAKNPSSARSHFSEIFERGILEAPENKKLTEEEMTRFRSMWPPGEHEAHERLIDFLKQKVNKYKDMRNYPSGMGTSSLSVHLAAGTLSARSAVASARAVNSTKKLDGGDPGIINWISEVAWRDFYKHVLVHWPYICMNKPFKPEYTNVPWEYNPSHFRAWCEGKTGYPFVDAAMRQLHHTGSMHNRARMTVASFLAKDLLLDWRLGERYFMEHLIDGDFASNNGGWGFSASCGVDPQPYFRIFNPLLQSEKYDPDGEYIRTWVPELKGVAGKAVHDPYSRGAGAEAQKRGYPRPIVVHKEARERALAKFKEGLGRKTA